MRLREALAHKLSKAELGFLKAAFDTVGSIAIIEIPPEIRKREKLIAETLLGLQKNIKTVVKKVGIHSGEFRLQKVRIIAGERTKETEHKEHNVHLLLHIEKVYFSPRLSTERGRILELVKPGESVLVMFSGCAPYPCVIAKNTQAKEVYGVEINPAGHEYGLKNVALNKLRNVKLFLGDVRKVVPRLHKKFDRVLMPLPRSAETFLDIALGAVKKGGVVHFYDFLHESEMPDAALQKIRKACDSSRRRCTIIKWTKCGQYSPGRFRICVDFRAG